MKNKSSGQVLVLLGVLFISAFWLKGAAAEANAVVFSDRGGRRKK